MDIVDTPCPHCGLRMQPGAKILLFKIDEESYGTGHFICPEEQEKLKMAMAKLNQSGKQLNHMSQPRLTSKSWLSRLLRRKW